VFDSVLTEGAIGGLRHHDSLPVGWGHGTSEPTPVGTLSGGNCRSGWLFGDSALKLMKMISITRTQSAFLMAFGLIRSFLLMQHILYVGVSYIYQYISGVALIFIYTGSKAKTAAYAAGQTLSLSCFVSLPLGWQAFSCCTGVAHSGCQSRLVLCRGDPYLTLILDRFFGDVDFCIPHLVCASIRYPDCVCPIPSRCYCALVGE